MSWLRIFEHLLPDAAAWRLRAGKTIRAFIEGLTGAPSDARDFVDLVHEDLFPSTTRFLPQWEHQFALSGLGSDADRRKRLEGAWQATGGQSPRYIQDVIQAAGFDLYVHECWDPGATPRAPYDPRLYTTQPLIGTVQCGEPLAQCGESGALCNRFLANDPKYLVNLNLTPSAPPPVPDDPARWPHFLYIGGPTFGDVVVLTATQRAELEQLLLRICPTQQWIVLLVESPGALLTEGGDRLLTEAGDVLVTEG